ncbi:MAG: flagellar export chaperone FliS [Spirochaetota bacterium]
MNQEGIHNYRETQIKTASRGKLIVILYDAMIRSLDIAIENIPKKKYDVVNNHIIKAQDIISELIVSLNMEAGDISKKLLNIYTFLNNKLIEGNMTKRTEPLKFVKRMACELREAWNQIVKDSPVTDIEDMDKSGGIDVAG